MASDDVTRYARGATRRLALIEAAASLLLEQGLASLSHRAVAARAGLPLASTTYYFDSADDLCDQALRHLAEGWATRAGAVVDALPATLDRAQASQAIVAIIGGDAPSEQMLLVYERYLDAGRHHRLRPVVATWNNRLKGLVHTVLVRTSLPADDDTAALVLAVADGAAVTALAEGVPPRDAVVAALHRILSLL